MSKDCIWVVDDDRSIRWVLDKALKQADMDVETFENADGVLKQLHKKTPDAIITDIRMPGMDGLALLKQIQTDHPNLPIILLRPTPIWIVPSRPTKVAPSNICPSRLILMKRSIWPNALFNIVVVRLASHKQRRALLYPKSSAPPRPCKKSFAQLAACLVPILPC